MTPALSARRARLKVVVSEKSETAHIERILHTRLRERRERRGAMARREAERQKQDPWVAPEELMGDGNPHDLEIAVRSGHVRARFYHVGRWWQHKEATPREDIRLGSDGRSLVDSEQWTLRVHLDDWRAYLGKPVDMPPVVTEVPAIVTEVPAPATEQVAPEPITRKRATKPASIEMYAEHQRAHLERTGRYASRKEDGAWVKADGFTRDSARKLRQRFYESLTPDQQIKFRKAASALGANSLRPRR